MEAVKEMFHPGIVAKHSALRSSVSDMLTDFDDASKIVIVNDVLRQPLDFCSFLELGGDTFIKVQEYARTSCDGIISLREKNEAPFGMCCRDYFSYYQLCNQYFTGLTLPIEAPNAIFEAIDDCGNRISFNLLDTVLYAIDIPLKTFTLELDTLFRDNFRMSDLILPGKCFCYYQFVSCGIVYWFIFHHISRNSQNSMFMWLGTQYKHWKLWTHSFCGAMFRYLHKCTSRRKWRRS